MTESKVSITYIDLAGQDIRLAGALVARMGDVLYRDGLPTTLGQMVQGLGLLPVQLDLVEIENHDKAED